MSMHEKSHMDHSANRQHYVRLLLMAALSFAAMFVLMYAMVDRFANVYPNVNQFYMAGLMTAPMVVIELALMSAMYPMRRLSLLLIGTSVVVGLACWTGIRQQVAVSDKQFLRSMIPHHAGALLMCGKAKLSDPDIIALCKSIAVGQQSEIDLMKARLRELEK